MGNLGNKTIMPLVLAFCLVFAMVFPKTAYANDYILQDELVAGSEGLDAIDVILAACMFMNLEDPDEDMWPDEAVVQDLVPLYNAQGQVVAYYLHLTSDGYAVINNKKSNPGAIEFGEGDNALIREILNNNENPVIVYNSPIDVYEMNGLSTVSVNVDSEEGIGDLYTTYPDLLEADAFLQQALAVYKEQFDLQVENVASPMGDGDYGFIGERSLPSGDPEHDEIKGYKNVTWAITSDYSDIAKDHCGAVCVTNLALYFASQDKSQLKVSGSVDETFKAVHSYVGNGPKVTIASDAVNYFASRGYTLKHGTVYKTIDGIKVVIDADKPVGILLQNALLDWHWVLCVGWTQYSVTASYLRIVTGWENSANNFYKIAEGSNWISATAYYIE